MIDATGHRDLRRRHRTPARSRNSKHEAAPGLEPVGDRGDLVRRPRTRRVSLSVSRIGDRPAGRVGHVDRRRDGRRRPSVVSSLSSPTNRNPGTKSATSSSRHSRREPAEQAAVARVEVAADADRLAVVQPRVRPGPGPAHQEPALAVAQDEVRDHLLEGGVRLHLPAAADSAPSRSSDRRANASRSVGPDAVPARHRPAIDERAGRRGPARRSRRPRSSALARGRQARRDGAASSSGAAAAARGRRASRRARPGTSRSGRRSPARSSRRSPRPSPTSPRASRVMSRQPRGGERPRHRPARRRAPPASRPATASTSAAATTSGRWLIAATASVVGRGVHPDRPRPARHGQRLDAPRSPARSSGSAGTTTHGRSTNRSAVGGPVARRLAARHRVAADEAQAVLCAGRARRCAPSCSPRR